jgi:hypothetical protein
LFRDPKNLKARFRRGLARKALGFYDAAYQDIERVCEEDPGNNAVGNELEITHNLMVSQATPLFDPLGVIMGRDEYPAFEEEMEDGYASDVGSETSDFNHEGNGTQCRFYNHDGCARGPMCRFSHAPDMKTVRDGLYVFGLSFVSPH